jgi:hypothetical protein
MSNCLNSLQPSTDQLISERPRETGSRFAVRRVSRRLSSSDTVRLDCRPNEGAPQTGDPQSYVTRRLDELVDERPMLELLLKDLRMSDSLTIQTEYSTYAFLVTDPVQKAGILTGGKLKRHMMSVILVGVLDDREDRGTVGDEPGRLRTGAQAVFYLKSAEGVRRITTSPIKKILHVRAVR